MKTSTISRNYSRLTPEERFRLILAARGRGDETEQDRLGRAAQRITLSFPDYSPYLNAFHELALVTFIELLDEAARYLELLERAEALGDDGSQDKESQEHVLAASDESRDRSVGERTWAVALSAGFVLRTKTDGWMRFCERLNVPPLSLWKELPGFERLQRALDLAESAAFSPDELLRWLNTVRREGEPEATDVSLTAAGLAASAEETFRQCVAWWGGESIPAARY